MTFSRWLPAALVAAACVVVPAGHAGVLYKLTDKAGKVTYVDAVPKDFVGEVQRMDMGSATNAMAPQKAAPAAPRQESEWERIIRKPPEKPSGRETRVKTAREGLEKAQSALQNLIDNSDHPDNWIYVGARPGSGFQNRFMKPEYLAKIEDAQKVVALAEDELRKAERDLF